MNSKLNYFIMEHSEPLLNTTFEQDFAEVELKVRRNYGLQEGWYKVKTRKAEYCLPRQITMYLLNKKVKQVYVKHVKDYKYVNKWTLETIANSVGIKRHATAINGIKKVSNYIETDKVFREVFNQMNYV